jgi:sec-independent protein translocase protein TatB
VFNGLSFDKLLLVAVIAVFLIGPTKLPVYASKLATLVRTLRNYANSAKDRMKDEMGPEFDEVDWKKLDPRQYDPRRIIREALLEDDSPAPAIRPTIKPVSATMADAASSDDTASADPKSDDVTSDSAADADSEKSAATTGNAASDAVDSEDPTAPDSVVEAPVRVEPPVLAEPVGRGAGRYDSEAT